MTKRKHKDEENQAEQERPEHPGRAGEQAGEAAPDPDAQTQAREPADPELAALRAERDDLLARLQRLSAEYLNYQKRVRREMAEARQFANADLMKDLLAVLDDMERAMQAAEANHASDDPLLKGMHLVYDKAMEALARHGLRRIEARDRPFDPTCHEAMMQRPSDQHEAPTVVEELQRGYELKGRVLRPARVVVAMPSAPSDAQDEQAPDQETEEKTESE